MLPNMIAIAVLLYFAFIPFSRRDIVSQSDSASYNYACEDCGKTFTSMEELSQHLSRLHSKSIGTAQT